MQLHMHMHMRQTGEALLDNNMFFHNFNQYLNLRGDPFIFMVNKLAPHLYFRIFDVNHSQLARCNMILDNIAWQKRKPN